MGNEQLVFKGDVPVIIKWNLPFNVCRRRASGICPSMFAGDAPLEPALQCLQATRLWNLPFNVCRRRASDHKVEFALQCLRTCNGKKTTTKHTVTNIEGRFPLYGGSALVAECLSKILLSLARRWRRCRRAATSCAPEPCGSDAVSRSQFSSRFTP